jgi:hypothetical protein
MIKILLSLVILVFQIRVQAMSNSDRYCVYLQQLHAQSLQKPGLGNSIHNFLTDIIQFGNSLTSKTSLKNIESEAIQKNMTFEVFQAWAKDQKKVDVPDRYKPDYIKLYMENVCGEITNSATFGSVPGTLFEATAVKQFDPNGHAYFSDFDKSPQEKAK